MRQGLGWIIDAITRSFREYTAHQGSLAAGGMAYFVLLAVAPAAVTVGAIAGALIGPEDTRAAVDSLLSRLPDAGSQIQEVTTSVVDVVLSSSATALTLASVVSLLIAVYAASKATTEIYTILFVGSVRCV